MINPIYSEINPQSIVKVSLVALFASILLRMAVPLLALPLGEVIDLLESYSNITFGFILALFPYVFATFTNKSLAKTSFVCFPSFTLKKLEYLFFLIFLASCCCFLFWLVGGRFTNEVIDGSIQNKSPLRSLFYISSLFKFVFVDFALFFSCYCGFKLFSFRHKSILFSSIILLSILPDVLFGARSRIFSFYFLPFIFSYMLFGGSLKLSSKSFLKNVFALTILLLVVLILTLGGEISLIESVLNRINVVATMKLALGIDFSSVLEKYPLANTFFPNSILGLVPSFIIERQISNPGIFVSELIGYSSISFATLSNFGEILVNFGDNFIASFSFWSLSFGALFYLILKIDNHICFALFTFFFSNNILNQFEDYFAPRLSSLFQYSVVALTAYFVFARFPSRKLL